MAGTCQIQGMAIAAIHLNSHITGGAGSFQGSGEFTAGSNGQGAIGMDYIVATGLAEGCSFITNGDTAEGVSINAGGNLINGNNRTQMQVCIATGAVGTLNSKYMIKYRIAGGDAGQTGGQQLHISGGIGTKGDITTGGEAVNGAASNGANAEAGAGISSQGAGAVGGGEASLGNQLGIAFYRNGLGLETKQCSQI